MQALEAEQKLRYMLHEAGFSEKGPKPLLAWEVFKSFVREPVDCAGDDILFECGKFSFTGEELFYLEFVRQFSFNDDTGEYDHMEQLHCTFTRQPTDELQGIQKVLWGFGFELIDDYFAAVEKLHEFQVATSLSIWKFELRQWEV